MAVNDMRVQYSDVDDKSIARMLTLRYVIALALIATMCTAIWVSMNVLISEQSSIAAIVNVAGRQRMLSQRTALFAHLLATQSVAQRPELRVKLREAVELMAQSHAGLIHGDSKLGLPATMSEEVRHLYFQAQPPLDTAVTTYIQKVREIAQTPDAQLDADNATLQYIEQVAPGTLVSALDHMVRQYQKEGEKSVARLQQTETAIWIATLMLLMLEAALIFHPLVRQVRRVIGRLHSTAQELTLHQEHLSQLVLERTDELERSNAALRESSTELRIAATAFDAQMGMVISDHRNVILRVNRAFTEITGYAAEEVIGKNPNILQSGRHDAAFYKDMFQHIAANGMWAGEIWNRNKDGSLYPGWLSITAVKSEANEITHYVAAFSDISERKDAENQILHLAFYDHLTNLPNRRLLMDRLRLATAACKRHGHVSALLFIDLDNFKFVNDTLGHHIGDELLQQVAQRLTACVRDEDTVARLGGDEFVIMLEALGADTAEAAAHAEQVSHKILAVLRDPYAIDIHSCRCTASIGVAFFTAEQEDVDDLLKRADLSMYQAKANGRNTLRFFDPLVQMQLLAKAQLEAQLRVALEQNQLRLFYQAQVTATGLLAGAEALVRWQHPERGLVPPAEFIPLAEQTGLIVPIGAWVLETACQQLAAWDTPGSTQALTLSVNVSAVQFRRPDFVDQVVAAISQTGVNPARLKLELTESLMVDDVEDVIAKMTSLKTLGVGFSMDDFGTGYSSLAYLSRLPLDQLKIDQGFVRDIESSDTAAVICAATISLAHSLKLKVVAEGVETLAQQYFLSTVHQCDFLQGYLFCKPLPLAEFEILLNESRFA
jgi:diguanylate cyclase (GGDEF)-like protein/PAS domain S-box-containing protein